MIRKQLGVPYRTEETHARVDANTKPPATIKLNSGGRAVPAFNQWAKGNKKHVPTMPTSHKS